MTEGVIQYHLDFSPQALADDFLLDKLNACRTWLFAQGLIGQDAQRYAGLGYGNVSQRVVLAGKPNAFLITGSQTGHLPVLDRQHYALVTACDPAQNQLQAIGETPPSSEAMTHAVLYQTLPQVHAVIHVHSPNLWQNAQQQGLPVTPKTVAYGTPEMAAAVRHILLDNSAMQVGLLAMLGHEDGIVAWGTTLADAEVRLMQLINTTQFQKDTSWFI